MLAQDSLSLQCREQEGIKIVSETPPVGQGSESTHTSCVTFDRHRNLLGLVFFTFPFEIIISVLPYEMASVQGDGITAVLILGG